MYAKYYHCFLTHWHPITSIVFLIETIYCKIFRCNYLRNKRTFFEFLFRFWSSRFNFEHFQKEDDCHSWCIFLLKTRKNVVREMSKKSHYRGPFHKSHGKRAETLLKSERQHLYNISWPLWTQFGWKKSLLKIRKILGLFVNPLTADEKYSLLNRGNLLRYFQMQLSKKRKMFSGLFFGFSKFRFNFEHFKKQEDPDSRYIFELADSEKPCLINV